MQHPLCLDLQPEAANACTLMYALQLSKIVVEFIYGFLVEEGLRLHQQDLYVAAD